MLVVTPASLKTEWEEQIQRFSGLSYRLIFGPHRERLRTYQDPAFFNIVNYEQMVRDALEVNRLLHPDIVVLDEAQRIKTWSTKTAQAIKRLQSRYAFVLSGTPIENRIDELYSIFDFLDPGIFGPLFRFTQDRGTRENSRGVPGERGDQSRALFRMGTNARAGEGSVEANADRICVAHGQCAATAATVGDPGIQERPSVPGIPQHRFGRHGAESADRKRRH